jgi:hypothetical protein
MISFQELLNLDRPFVPVTVKVGDKEIALQARRLSAADQDAIEAYFSDEYNRLVLEYFEPQNGKQSRFDEVITVYRSRPRADLLRQILGTRFEDVQARTFQISGLDIKEVRAELANASEERSKELDTVLAEAKAIAEAEIRSEYDSKSDDDLANIMASVNTNMKALTEARQRQTCRRLFYILYDLDGKRYLPSPEDAAQLSKDTIAQWLQAVDIAFLTNVVQDLPFGSAADPAPNGPTPSQSNSGRATKGSGKRTKTTQSDFK